METRQGLDPDVSSVGPAGPTALLQDPAGITLLVVDGPYDGLVFGDATSVFTLGRAAGNAIELPLDNGISGDHCSVRFSAEAGCWVLAEDRGRPSTNGVWFNGRKISTTQKLGADDEFVIGATVIRCQGPGSAKTFLPAPSKLETATREVLQRLDSTAAQGFGAATMLALHEQCSALTDRHLFLGLASVNAHNSVISHGNGVISSQFISHRVRENVYWTNSKAWIAQLVGATSKKNCAFADQLATTPRVLKVLTVAAAQADSFGSEQITSDYVFYGLFIDASSRLPEWFVAEGGDLKSLLTVLGREKTGVSKLRPGRKSTKRATTDSIASALPVRRPTAVDPAVVDLAGSTLHTATKYRLASADDRRKALKEMITKVIAEISADRRRLILEQLRECFPVIHAAPVDGAELVRVRQRVSELEAALKVTDSNPAESAIPIPWSDVLSAHGDLQTDLVQPADANALILVNHIVGFSLAVERFIIGFVAEFTQRGTMSGRLSIPGFKTSILRTIKTVVSGQSTSEELQRYLAALETWLVATVAAYHTAPEDWFTGYWDKVGPTRIQASVPTKILSDAKCWNQYKNIVRRISPDLVADEIHALVRDNAQKQFNELMDRRNAK